MADSCKHKKNQKVGYKSGKKSRIKREKTVMTYRTKAERQAEVKILINKLNEMRLTTEYDAVKQFYKLMLHYISSGERILVDIPFPEMKKRIEGVLAINTNEPVAIRLKYEKFG